MRDKILRCYLPFCLIFSSILFHGSAGAQSNGWISMGGPTDVSRFIAKPSGELFLGGDINGAHYKGNASSGWVTINNNLGNRGVTAFGLNALGEVIAGTGYPSSGYPGGEVFWLPNGSTTWQQGTPSPMGNEKVTVFERLPNGDIIAGVSWNPNIYKSSDNGRSYALIGTHSGPGYTDVINSMPNGEIWLGGETNDVYSSNDNGRTWQPVDLNGDGVGDLSIANGYHHGVQEIAVNRLGEPLVGRCKAKCLQRYTGGQWKAVTGLIDFSDVEDIILLNNGELFAATEHGVYRSVDDGASWSSYTSTGLPTGGYVTHIYIDFSGYLYAIVRGQGLFRTSQPVQSGSVTPTPTVPSISTSTATPTATHTPTQVVQLPTSTPTRTATFTNTAIPTATRTSINSFTPTMTSTPVVTSTPSATPTEAHTSTATPTPTGRNGNNPEKKLKPPRNLHFRE